MAKTSNKRMATAELQQIASAHYQAGRLEEALASCTEIIRRHPKRPDVQAFAGMISLKLGDNAGAARFYRTAVNRQPDFAEAHYNLGTALLRLKKYKAAANSFRQAIEIYPDMAAAHHNLGNALQALNQLEAAEAAYLNTLRLAPGAADTARNLGMVLQKLKRLDEAENAFRQAITLNPGWSNAYNNLVNLLFKKGGGTQAIEVCDQWLAHSPGNVEAMAFKCAALNEAGQIEARDYLLDFENLVQVTRWTDVPGYDNVAGFNEALADHIRDHPTLKLPAPDDPTYHHPKLHITEEILGDNSAPMVAFEAMIRSAIDTFREALADMGEHPFVAHWPARWRLSSWGVVLQGAGNLEPHIHLEGYLGGVYYPLMPDVIDDEAQKPGWFELGRPPSELPLKAAPKIKPFKPEEGLMILFPGYCYHATRPFKSTQQRISVAFDVVAET